MCELVRPVAPAGVEQPSFGLARSTRPPRALAKSEEQRRWEVIGRGLGTSWFVGASVSAEARKLHDADTWTG